MSDKAFKLPRIGARNGDFVLIERRRNKDGSITDKWRLDPIEQIKPDGTTHLAYKYAASNALAPIPDPGVATTPYTSTDYQNIASDNSIYEYVTASAGTDTYANIARRYVFDLSRYYGISQIIYKFDGYYSVSGLSVEQNTVMHRTSTGWVVGGAIPTSDGAGWDVTVTLTNISDVVIAGKFTFGTVLVGYGLTGSGSITLYTDCIEIEITFQGYIVSDSGTGSETAALSLVIRTVSDEGLGQHEILLGQAQTVSDEGLGQHEIFLSQAQNVLMDAGLSEDYIAFVSYRTVQLDEAKGEENVEIKDITMIIQCQQLIQMMELLIKFMPILTLSSAISAIKPKPKTRITEAAKKAAKKPRK